MPYGSLGGYFQPPRLFSCDRDSREPVGTAEMRRGRMKKPLRGITFVSLSSRREAKRRRLNTSALSLTVETKIALTPEL